MGLVERGRIDLAPLRTCLPDSPCRAATAARVTMLPIPHDYTDGFLAAFWRRPLRRSPSARAHANERRLQDDPRAGSTTNTALIDATETLIRLDG